MQYIENEWDITTPHRKTEWGRDGDEETKKKNLFIVCYKFHCY